MRIWVLKLRTVLFLLDQTLLWPHQLVFSDKHPQPPSWGHPTPPSILLHFTCFASWQHIVKWKHLLSPSLRYKQESGGYILDFTVFVSACPDAHSRSVNLAKVWGRVHDFLQPFWCLPWHTAPGVLTLGEMNSKIFYGGGFSMPFPSQHFRASELNICTQNLWTTAPSLRCAIVSIWVYWGIDLEIKNKLCDCVGGHALQYGRQQGVCDITVKCKLWKNLKLWVKMIIWENMLPIKQGISNLLWLLGPKDNEGPFTDSQNQFCMKQCIHGICMISKLRVSPYVDLVSGW